VKQKPERAFRLAPLKNIFDDVKERVLGRLLTSSNSD
jgi:hypothetical protein